MMNIQEALNKKLDACIHVSNWAIDNGFDAAELWMSWDSWLKNSNKSASGLRTARRERRGFHVPSLAWHRGRHPVQLLPDDAPYADSLNSLT